MTCGIATKVNDQAAGSRARSTCPRLARSLIAATTSLRSMQVRRPRLAWLGQPELLQCGQQAVVIAARSHGSELFGQQPAGMLEIWLISQVGLPVSRAGAGVGPAGGAESAGVIPASLTSCWPCQR